MEAPFWLRVYGVLGYSLSVFLAIFWASIGIAYCKAERGKRLWLVFVAGAVLYAVLFAYLVLISIEPPWLDRTIMQPAMRTVALGASVCLAVFTALVLRREAKATRRPPQTTPQNGSAAPTSGD